MMKPCMGIDIGDTLCNIFAFSNAGEIVLDSIRVETLDEFGWWEPMTGFSCEYLVRACFEVGPHYVCLCDLLMEYCQETEAVNPTGFAVICRSQRKTDTIDAQKLAEGLHRGDLPPGYAPDKVVRQDRRLISLVRKLSQGPGKAEGRIRSLLTPLRIRCPCRDILGQKSRRLLEGDVLMDQPNQLDKAVRERVTGYGNARNLSSIPGFDPLTTLAVVSTPDAISRFDTPGCLAGYFGVCGSIRQSGQSTFRGPMTKLGNVHV